VVFLDPLLADADADADADDRGRPALPLRLSRTRRVRESRVLV
jgi:hypothetical protein